MPASHAPARSAAAAGGPVSISWMMRLPMTTASASAAIARALAASRMPKPTPTGSATCRRISASLRADLGGVEMAGAGHALERDVVDVAARDARDGGDPRVGRRRRQQEDRRDRALAQQCGELRRLLRRIVDDQHAVDAGRLRAIGERCRRPSPRSDWRSPSARPASPRRSCGTRRRSRARRRGRRPARARARRRAGSPGRRPSDRRTARRARSRRRPPRRARA